MDIIVLLAEADDGVEGVGAAGAAVPIARVRSAPDSSARDVGGWFGRGRGAREVVTLYGAAEADRLAVAIAAACEGRLAEGRLTALAGGAPPDAVRQFGVWADRGAVGDVAWRDPATGRLVTEAVAISAAAIAGTAGRLLLEHGRAIRQTVAGLAMADWPEGTRRAIQVSLGPLASFGAPAEDAGADLALLASLREADGDQGAWGAWDGGDV